MTAKKGAYWEQAVRELIVETLVSFNQDIKDRNKKVIFNEEDEEILLEFCQEESDEEENGNHSIRFRIDIDVKMKEVHIYEVNSYGDEIHRYSRTCKIAEFSEDVFLEALEEIEEFYFD
jgi:hypothetical protein